MYFLLIKQLLKYALVGISVAIIDFSVLNLLSFTTGITAGVVVGWINAPGFMLAVTFSYFLNKYWTFEHRLGPRWMEFSKFFLVALAGLLLNSFVLVYLTTNIPPPYGISAVLWLNIAKVFSTATVPLISFAGYKFLVFKK